MSIITDRVRSTAGRLCFDTCLSVCLSTPRGGTPARSRWGVPLPGLTGEYPHQVQAGGVPKVGHPHQTWPGSTPSGGYPTSGPLIGPGWGVPHLGYPSPIGPGWGVPLLGGGYPTSGNRWSTWYAAVSMPLAFTQEDFLVRTFLFYVKIQLQWTSKVMQRKVYLE